MPRFDVYRARRTGEYLLDVQADLLDQLPSRVVVPLLPPTAALPAIRDLNPLLALDGEVYALMTHYMTAVQRRELGRPVGNLAAERDAITRALDVLLTGL